MKIKHESAVATLRSAAEQAEKGLASPEWVEKVKHLSKLCDEGVSKTHIAFLGTALIAKSVNREVDLFAIKPDHAPENENAYSARTLCHGVLVPIAAELGINIGVTGREPLNNQPYFRMTKLDDGTPVHPKGKDAFEYMLTLVRELQALTDVTSAQAALAAFIAVRKTYQTKYIAHSGNSKVDPDKLAEIIHTFVVQSSEGGKRAQAVVAGLLDVIATPERVESGRINDPSRKYPGDVCIRSQSSPSTFEKAFEVRDKPVSESDVIIFGKKCVDMGAQEAAMVIVSDEQALLDNSMINTWAKSLGLNIMLFKGWESFVEQILFWSSTPSWEAANLAVGYIHERLIAVEASEDAVKLWHRMTAS